METTVKIIHTTDQITLLQHISLNSSIAQIKQAISALQNVPIEQQLLQYKNESLIDTCILNNLIEPLVDPTFKLIIFNFY